MGWMIAIALLIFYVLGTWIFHATGPVRFLPYVAVIVFIIDRLLIRHYRSRS
jgi:hypothetical protein